MFEHERWLRIRACEFWDALVRFFSDIVQRQGDLPHDTLSHLQDMLRRRRSYLLRLSRSSTMARCASQPLKWISAARDCRLLLRMAAHDDKASVALRGAARRSVKNLIVQLRKIARGDHPEVRGFSAEQATFHHWMGELHLNLLLLNANPSKLGISSTELVDLRRTLEERVGVPA